MKKNKIIEQLKPLSLLNFIFNYVKDDNLKLKLFTYSKFFQKKFSIQLIDYQERYINQLGINFNNYLAVKYKYKENELKMKLEDNLLKNNIDININDIQKIAIKNFEKKMKLYQDKINNNEFFIDIYSPFFDSLSKNEIFDNFTIKINVEDIEEFNLKNDYITIFDKMNKSNSNYSSIYFGFKNSEDIKYLEDFNINFGQIKKLTIFQIDSEIDNYNDFFKMLFSFNNIGNNLIYLHLDIVINKFKQKNIEVEAKSFENLNNFKSLKYLKIYGFIFKPFLNLNLINLEYLSISHCSNIIINDKLFNLKYLLLNFNINVKPKNMLKLPELEECALESKLNFKDNYRLMIDFSSLKKIKVFKADTSDFLQLENNNILAKINLNPEENISKENEIKIIEKILSIKTLNYINFYLTKIDIDDILNVPGENFSIQKFKLWSNNITKEFFFNKIQNKFPNVSELSIFVSKISALNEISLEINENPISKVNRLFLNISGEKEIKIDIQSFEKLESIDIYSYCDIINLKEALPFFNDNYQIKYNSLNRFQFRIYNKKEISFELLNNLYNNIDNMPNLKSFFLRCFSKSISESFYKQIIRKLLSLELKSISLYLKNVDSISLNEKKYTFDELKEIYPEFNKDKFEYTIITKL